MRHPDTARLTFPALVLAGLLASGCEDFSRFKQELYECDSNRHGLVDIDIREMKVGKAATVAFTDGTRQMVLTESTDTAFTLTEGKLILRIDRTSGTVRLTRGTRYLTISCQKSEFRM